MDATAPSNAMRSPQAPTRCGVPVPQRTIPFAARYDRGALQRGTYKNDVGRVHKFGMELVRKFGTWARSELGIGARRSAGIPNWGHSDLGSQ